MMRATVFVRDSARVLRGSLPVVAGSQAVLPVNGIGSWRFDLDATHPKAQRVEPGGGVFVVDDDTDQVVFNGPATQILNTAAADGPVRTLQVSGVTDKQHLADREAYPDPTAAVTAQTATARYEATGPAGTVIRALVNSQAATGALTARRVPGLTLGPTGDGLGTTVSVSVRFKPHLLETIQALAATGGLVFRVVQVGGNLVFRVWVPRDLTSRARFSRDLANLGAFSYGLSAPTVTHAPVLGQGEGVLRTVRERVNAPAVTMWGRRIERSIDRRDSDTDDVLDQAGDEALLDGAPAASLEMDPIDLPKLRFGRDYDLGDRVTVELGDGVAVADVVRQVTLTWEAQGVVAKPLIGPESARDTREPLSVRRIRDLSRRLGKLEADR